MKRFDHEADLLNIGAGGDSLAETFHKRSEEGWELVGHSAPLPIPSDAPRDAQGHPLWVFRILLSWKRPVG